MSRTRRRTFIVNVFVTMAFSLWAAGATELVAHFEFEDSGNLGHDSSGMGNHITTISDVTQEEGKFGSGAYFDEERSSVFRLDGGLNGFTGLPGRTFAAWVKLDSAATGFDGILSQDSGGCCNTRLLTHPDRRPFINLTEHLDRHLTGSPAISIGEWAHYTLVGSNENQASVARVYLNGREVGVESFPNPMPSAASWNTYLGVGELGNVHRLTGTLDDVRIYEGALTIEEIQDVMDPPTTSLKFTELAYHRENYTFRFSWNSKSGKVYDLLSSVDLSSWSVYKTYQDITASGTGTNTLDDVPLEGPARFFVIRERTPTRAWSRRADGFASVNALGQNGTTGGAGGRTVTVTTRAELEEYAGKEEPYIIRVQGSIDMSVGQGEWVYEVNVASDKTIIGVGSDAELVNGGLSISSFAEPGGGSYDDWVELGVRYGDHYPRAHNVIIRNLTIHNSTVNSAGDGLTIDNAHHIWIDQCHFHNNVDGCIDSRFDATFLTVSWCVFSDHAKTFGIGWTPNLTAHVTLHHNWFRNTVSRNPSGDNILRAHCYNNYLSGVSSGHHSRGRTNMIVQNCLFENAGNPLMLDDGTLVETGCIFRGTTGRRETRGPAFFDPADFYEFTLDVTEELPAILSKYAGPQGVIGVSP